jgi:hypothetical protein
MQCCLKAFGSGKNGFKRIKLSEYYVTPADQLQVLLKYRLHHFEEIYLYFKKPPDKFLRIVQRWG